MSLGFASPVLAADMMPTKAPAAEPLPYWYYDGFAEVGYRFDLNGADKNTLGPFYKYRDLRPGVFGNFYFGAHRTNPIDFVLWGKNVGYDDQAFGLDFAKVGEHYLSLGWDETPHVYARNAKTTYSPLGGNVLSTPTYPYPPSAASQAFVNANSNTFNLGFRRDTATAKYRWTPTEAWDITADYSHLHREGTQSINAVSYSAPAGRGGADTRNPIELPKPVDDTTQNGNIKGEYAGSTPWGKPFNIALGAGFSLYNNSVGCGTVAGTIAPGSPDANCLTFQNPWNAANTATDPLWNRYSLLPDNQAQTFSVSGGIGLPMNSRYMGTFQYSRMTQDETFLSSTINPLAVPATLTASSLNGDARTTLFNNVLNTAITSDLKSTLRYRYYDYHSRQMPITLTGLATNPDTGAAAGVEPALTTTPSNFNKQNASAELVWRPTKWLNTGAVYEWERWRRRTEGVDTVTLLTDEFDVVTNENAVKVFADAKWDWSTVRGSLRYGQRRLDGNDYIRIANNNNAFRTVDVQDRNTTQGQASWAIEAIPMVTITPFGGFRYDDYQTDGITEFGVDKLESWNVGGEVAWNMNKNAHFYVSYAHDDGHRKVFQNTVPSNLILNTSDKTDTFIVGAKVTAIPDKLFLNATYTYTRATSAWSSDCGPGGCLFTPMPVFPDSHNTNHRVDMSAKYMLGDSLVKTAGVNAQTFVKARVIWERNSAELVADDRPATRLGSQSRRSHFRPCGLLGHRQPELRRGCGDAVLRLEVVSWL